MQIYMLFLNLSLFVKGVVCSVVPVVGLAGLVQMNGSLVQCIGTVSSLNIAGGLKHIAVEN